MNRELVNEKKRLSGRWTSADVPIECHKYLITDMQDMYEVAITETVGFIKVYIRSVISGVEYSYELNDGEEDIMLPLIGIPAAYPAKTHFKDEFITLLLDGMETLLKNCHVLAERHTLIT